MPYIYIIPNFLMTLDSNGFFQIQKGQCREDICLKECYKEFKEPKWYNDNTSQSHTSGRDKCTNIGHNSDKDNSREDIGEKSDRKRECSREFSDEVEPSDRNIDELLDRCVSAKIEEIVSEVREESFVTDSGHLRNEDNRYCHDDGRIEVGVDRTEIFVSAFEDEVDPIESETEDIGEEDIHEESTDQRKEGTSCFPVFHGIEKEVVDTLDEVYTNIPESWKCPSFDGNEEKSNRSEKNRHEYPHGQDRIGYRKTADGKTMHRLPLDARDMDRHPLSFFSLRACFAAHNKNLGKP